MRLKTRISIIILATLLGLLTLSGVALYSLRHSILNERQSQIRTTLELAVNMTAQYQQQEQLGKLTHEEAQNKAKEALRGLRRGDDYIFVRTTDNIRLVHPNAESIGKVDLGVKLPSGRTSAQAFADALAISKVGFVKSMIARPGQTEPQPKLIGVTSFKPWGWVFGVGFYVDDIETTFWKQAGILVIVNLILLGVVTFLIVRMTRQILSQIGGEPQYAAEIAQGIANGDLSRSIDAHGKADSLLGSMRVMQQGLHDIVARFNQASTTLATASQQLTEETEQISRGSQQTSEATAATAAAVEQMTVSISHISSSARETESNSRQAAELATHGEQLAKDAAEEIRRISSDISAASDLIRGLVDRSREIDGMSAVIKEIADQTNLLALNAAIEAARAGEQGRGFAVVADEVRKLAERTGGATQDITRTIRAVQSDTDVAAARMEGVRDQVTLGVELAEKAAQALREINDGARATLEKTREVANAAQEQSQVSNNIAGNVERIAQMVEESDAAVQAAHDQVRQLDELARELNQVAVRFKL
ncbi:methyl-accepting chemotaxis sensory transducer with Cache sensor [Formivibrio citricus]|uniref:Methyl-accepting chemotaxis sensory transducer with Cache sensor n=1 Tax=Formivibrio citricus TaxID=83765 RepID=A0A1I5AXZ8_9NEIS|nr:methyl-accepting chemotaxis protein [Formivibrio citricus]SFN67335.1 methyl-accepting chemotaxis sensory transducer with Cache sensor [Formivibrio citricus]